MRLVRVSAVVALAVSALSMGHQANARPPAAKKPKPSFLVQVGTAEDDQVAATVVDSKGNVYVGGFTDGDIDGAGPGTSAGSDAYIIKYSSSGALRWVRQFGKGSEILSTMAVGADDSVYAAGTVTGDFDGDGPLRRKGGDDVFIVKFDAAGKQKWAKQIGGPNADYADAISVAGGTLVVVGDTLGGIADIDQPLIGNTDVFIAKYSTAGKKKWIRQYGSTEGDFGTGVAVGKKGLIYFCATTLGDVDGPGVGTFNLGSFDIAVGAVASDGAPKWFTQIGSLAEDDCYDVVVDSAGSAYFAGTASGDLDGGGRGAIHAGVEDAFIAKYSPAGKQKWVTMFGTTVLDKLRAISIDAKGRLYAAGSTTADLNGTFPQKHAGNNDGWAARVTSTGLLDWLYQWGGPGSDEAFDIAVSKGGSVYVGGETGGDIDGPMGPNTSAGRWDGFLLKLTNDGEYVAP